MKPLKLRGEDRVSPEERVELLGIPIEQALAEERRYQNMAEMAYSPPEQQDAFVPTLTIADAGKRLQAYFERVERLEDEKQALQDDIAEVFKEAKGEGFDVAAMRALLKIRGDDQAEAKLAMIKLYHDETGMTVWPA